PGPAPTPLPPRAAIPRPEPALPPRRRAGTRGAACSGLFCLFSLRGLSEAMIDAHDVVSKVETDPRGQESDDGREERGARTDLVPVEGNGRRRGVEVVLPKRRADEE